MVTLQEARRVIKAAEIKASEIGEPMNIAVVDEGSRATFAIGRPILRNPCIQSWERDGIRRRHPADARRKSGRRRGIERRFRRAGSRCSGSWSERVLDFKGSEHSWQAIVE
jgi:hypothetical protein